MRKRPDEVERIEDPKHVLDAVYDLVTNRRKGRKRNAVSAYFELIGEKVSVSELSKVPSFARLQSDLVRALQALQFIR